LVGRTPSSARDALVPPRPARGPAAVPGDCPTVRRLGQYVAVVAGCFCMALGLSTVAQRINNDAYDWMSSRYQPDWEPQSVVVGIDEKTFEALGGPRARRTIISQALDEIAQAKPRLVAIDVILHDAGDPIEDARLEASLRATPNLILPSEVVDHQWEDPLPRFAPADPRHLGLVELPTDRLDGVTRQIPLERIEAHQHRWALSLVALSVALGQPIVTSSASNDVQVGGLTIPVTLGSEGDSEGRPLLIRYLPLKKIPVIPVQEVAQNLSAIRGKAVFLGETAQSATRDRLLNPYGESVVGVIANAQAFETLIHGDYLTNARDYSVLLVSLGIAAAAGLIFGMLAGWPAYAAGAVLLGFAGMLPVLLFQHNIVFPFVAPVAVAWLCSTGAAIYQHFFVRRQLDRTESERSRYQQAIHWAAHEMRTPLTAIQGSSEIMTRYNLPEEKRNQLSGMINAESKRLARIIQTFLDVERLADGQMDLKREPFDAAEMVDGCMQRVKPLAERKQIGMALEGEVDGVLVGDRELMEYAFYNLLTNAVKYSRSGTQIRVFSKRNGTDLRLAVQDQGIGMDSKEVQNIFKKFYRTKGAEASGEVGTGIGLSIVEQIVTRHGGRIDVSSEPGKGSCFTIVMKVHALAQNAKTADRRG
jgi:signal transduction histidine kinase